VAKNTRRNVIVGRSGGTSITGCWCYWGSPFFLWFSYELFTPVYISSRGTSISFGPGEEITRQFITTGYRYRLSTHTDAHTFLYLTLSWTALALIMVARVLWLLHPKKATLEKQRHTDGPLRWDRGWQVWALLALHGALILMLWWRLLPRQLIESSTTALEPQGQMIVTEYFAVWPEQTLMVNDLWLVALAVTFVLRAARLTRIGYSHRAVRKARGEIRPPSLAHVLPQWRLSALLVHILAAWGYATLLYTYNVIGGNGSGMGVVGLFSVLLHALIYAIQTVWIIMRRWWQRYHIPAVEVRPAAASASGLFHIGGDGEIAPISEEDAYRLLEANRAAQSGEVVL
jgi:hypothetical protein